MSRAKPISRTNCPYEYSSWIRMWHRCVDKSDKSYAAYGGQGTKVCERWIKFENFYSDMGKRPKGFTLHRINNEVNYQPDNCKWASRVEQNRNRKWKHKLPYNKRPKLKVLI